VTLRRSDPAYRVPKVSIRLLNGCSRGWSGGSAQLGFARLDSPGRTSLVGPFAEKATVFAAPLSSPVSHHDSGQSKAVERGRRAELW